MWMNQWRSCRFLFSALVRQEVGVDAMTWDLKSAELSTLHSEMLIKINFVFPCCYFRIVIRCVLAYCRFTDRKPTGQTSDVVSCAAIPIHTFVQLGMPGEGISQHLCPVCLKREFVLQIPRPKRRKGPSAEKVGVIVSCTFPFPRGQLESSLPWFSPQEKRVRFLADGSSVSYLSSARKGRLEELVTRGTRWCLSWTRKGKTRLGADLQLLHEVMPICKFMHDVQLKEKDLGKMAA